MRFPKENATPAELARFSFDTWQSLDPFYNFWVTRWQRSIDFIRSLHWKALRELEDSQIPDWKRYAVANMTLAFYSDYLAQFLQSRVRFSAVPASPDPEDVSSAELGDFALRYAWNKLELDAKKIDLTAWLASTGNADLRVFWDTDTGDMIPLALPSVGPDGKQILVPINPDTGQADPSMPKPIMVDAGEIGVEVIPPQLSRCGLSKSVGKLIGYLLTYDDACARYGDKVAENLSYQQHTGALAADMLSTLSIGATGSREKTALIIEHYLPRGNKRPEGLWWASSGDQMVKDPSPLPGRYIPSAHFRWVPVPGHPEMGMSPVYDLTFSNKAYDEILSRILEWLNKVVPKVFRQTGDGLKYGDITDEPFQEVVTQPGLAPVIPNVPGPPEHFFRIKADLAEDALTIGGYRFQRPPSLPAGSMQGPRKPTTLQGEGEVVALALINSKPAWQRVGYILLDYMAKFYTEPRMTSVVGPDRTYQWREFSGTDLKNLNATIVVDELPLYTWNRQALRDTVIGLLESQSGAMLFTDAEGNVDRDRLDAAMNAVGIDVATETLDPDVLEAKNEIAMFKVLQEGQEAPQVMPWQNHTTHVAEKTRAMKSLTYRSWPKFAQDALLENVSAHEQATAQAEQAAQDKMINQERALREVRAQAETTQNVRTALGEGIVEALVSILTDEKAFGGSSPAKGKEKK